MNKKLVNVQEFERCGYTVVRSALDQNILQLILSEIQQLCDDNWPDCPRQDIFYQDISNFQSLKQVQHVNKYSIAIQRVAIEICQPIAQELFESGTAKLIQVQFFNKPPCGLSKATPWHQDGYYFHIKPKSGALTFWLALDETESSNGSIHYAKVNHKVKTMQ